MRNSADLMAQAGGLIAVWLDVAQQHEEEFNAWYKYEHLQQVVGLRGFLSGRRYAADFLYPKWLALYETVDESAEQALLEMMEHPTPWSLRIRPMYGANRQRHNYRRLAYASASTEPYGSVILTVQGDAAPGRAHEVEGWMTDNAGLALDVPGCTAARYYASMSGHPKYLELYEFADASFLRSREWHSFLTGGHRLPLAQALVSVIQQRYQSVATPYLRPD